MITPTHWTFLVFVVLILLTLVWKKPPVLAAAMGLFAVGIADSGNVITSISIAFRALSLATGNLLSVILLIGIVVGLTRLLKDTGADQTIVRPILRLNRMNRAYWVLGIVMWLLTLMIWPTPAITLLGAVAVPALKDIGLNPLGLALSLTLFGEGMGLSGDFIIQGAPSLLSKASGIPVSVLLSASFPLVLGSGFLAALTGSLLIKFKLGPEQDSSRGQQSPPETAKHLEPMQPSVERKFNKSSLIAFIVIFSYGITVLLMLLFKIRGDSASAFIGGTSFLMLSIGVLIQERKKAFVRFVDYLKEGMRFSMGVFVPIVVMFAFFFLGTKTGFQQIFQKDGLGFFSDFAYILANYIPLTPWTVGGLVALVAILGSMDGSGFSSLPLIGGIAMALSQAAHLSPVPFAVLGQIIGIWTGAALIPWGFSSVTSAVTDVKPGALFRLTFPCYLVAICTAFGWTMLRI